MKMSSIFEDKYNLPALTSEVSRYYFFEGVSDVFWWLYGKDDIESYAEFVLVKSTLYTYRHRTDLMAWYSGRLWSGNYFSGNWGE
jgi:hypothetical protein